MTALIRRDDTRLTAEATEHAVARRDDVLASSALIGRVSDAVENSECAAMASMIRGLLSEVEAARKACKEPVLDFGRRIDVQAKSFVAPLEAELARLNTLAGDWHQANLARERAAEAAAKAELADIERRREEALARANTLEDRNDIVARANEEAQAAKPAIVRERTKGQRVEEEWVIESINEMALASVHPELIRKIEFDMAKVKIALTLLGKLPGVTARKQVKVTALAAKARLLEAS